MPCLSYTSLPGGRSFAVRQVPWPTSGSARPRPQLSTRTGARVRCHIRQPSVSVAAGSDASRTTGGGRLSGGRRTAGGRLSGGRRAVVGNHGRRAVKDDRDRADFENSRSHYTTCSSSVFSLHVGIYLRIRCETSISERQAVKRSECFQVYEEHMLACHPSRSL